MRHQISEVRKNYVKSFGIPKRPCMKYINLENQTDWSTHGLMSALRRGYGFWPKSGSAVHTLTSSIICWAKHEKKTLSLGDSAEQTEMIDRDKGSD